MKQPTDIVKSIRACVSRFKKLHILVFGDLILDIYLKGEVKRISPEAPVPILNTKEYDYRLGGGGNVACNLSNMGVQVTLASVIGKDENGQYLLDFMKEFGLSVEGVLTTPKRKTSVKTRVIAQSQQIVRIDEEDTHNLENNLIKKVIDRIKGLTNPIDGIIISDYGKGMVNQNTIKALVTLATKAGIFLALDPKQRNFSFYQNIDVMTPNHFEAEEDIGKKCETLAQVKSLGLEIMAKHCLRQLIITRGDKGLMLFDSILDQSSKARRDKKPSSQKNIQIYNLPTFNRSLYDVSGAGDTVIALYTASYLASGNAYLSALIANISAGIVVSHFGTYPVNKKEFLMEVENKHLLKKIVQGNHHE